MRDQIIRLSFDYEQCKLQYGDENRMKIDRNQMSSQWHGGIPSSPLATALLIELEIQEKQREIRKKH